MPSAESIAIKEQLTKEGFCDKWRSKEAIRAYVAELPPYPALPPRREGWQAAAFTDEDGERMDYFASAALKPGDPAVVYFHGGAYIEELLPPHFAFARALAAGTGMTVVLPNYPVIRFKGSREDADAVTVGAEALNRLAAGFCRFVQDAAGGGPLHLIGDSAGAALALNAARALAEAGRPAASLTLLSPWADAATDNPFIARLGLPGRDVFLQPPGLGEIGRLFAEADAPAAERAAAVKRPPASPLFGPLGGLPRTLLLIGTADCLLPDARLLRDKLAEAGVPLAYREFPEMMHAWPLFPMPEAEEARTVIGSFLAAESATEGSEPGGIGLASDESSIAEPGGTP